MANNVQVELTTDMKKSFDQSAVQLLRAAMLAAEASLGTDDAMTTEAMDHYMGVTAIYASLLDPIVVLDMHRMLLVMALRFALFNGITQESLVDALNKMQLQETPQ